MIGLTRIPEKFFEVAGTLVGFSASGFIGLQIYAELSTTNSSTLSPLFVMGFMLNYAFWILYGLRFGRVAVWLVNVAAVILQTSLLIIIMAKGLT